MKHPRINSAAIKRYRKDAGLSQQELAAQTGYSLRQVHHLENSNDVSSLAAFIIDKAHAFYNEHENLPRPTFITCPSGE